MLAACLAFRAIRLRRRYRSAHQQAIANGEILHPLQYHGFGNGRGSREEFWGFGGLAAWAADGSDRFGPPTPGVKVKREKFGKTPVLWEAEVEDKVDPFEDTPDWRDLKVSAVVY
jgi:hypothetical protein